MSAESELNAALLDYVPLTDVVDARIYPDFIAQEILPPAIVYQRPGETQYVHTIHDSTVWGSLVRMEVWCLDMTRIGAEGLADLVEEALAFASQQLPPTEVLPINRRTEYEPESERHVSVVECNIWPRGATP